MDYAKFSIIVWIVATIILAIVCKRSFFKQFGIPQHKILRMDWRAYLVCMMMLGGVIAVGLTFFIKSVS